MFGVKLEDKNKLESYLELPQLRNLLPVQLKYTKFAFGLPVVNKTSGIEVVDVYALEGNRENKPELSGAVITDASQSYSQTGDPSVSMQMNSKGAKIWEEMTGKAYSSRSQIAIVLDNVVYSAPGAHLGQFQEVDLKSQVTKL